MVRLQAQAQTQLDCRHRLQAFHGPMVHEPGPSEPGSVFQNQGTG